MRVEITREGKRFLLALVVVGFTSLNTGNNLMYLTFAMMASLAVVSLAVGFLNLKGLEARVQIDEPVFAGQSREVLLTVLNRKRVPSYSLRLLLKGVTEEGFYFPRVPPGGTSALTERMTFQKRGVYEMQDLRLQSSFPFIFFRFYQRATPAGRRGNASEGLLRVVVYPRLLQLMPPLDIVVMKEEQAGRLPHTDGEDLHSLRQYRHGDHWRRIHWKSTAKRGDLMVREFLLDEPERVTVVLDNSLCIEEEAFEKAVSLAATLLYEAVQRGYSVRLITSTKAFPFGSGMEHLWRILDCLATVRSPVPFNTPPSERLEGVVLLVLPEERTSLGHLIHRADRVFYAGNL